MIGLLKNAHHPYFKGFFLAYLYMLLLTLEVNVS